MLQNAYRHSRAMDNRYGNHPLTGGLDEKTPNRGKTASSPILRHFGSKDSNRVFFTPTAFRRKKLEKCNNCSPEANAVPIASPA
jgi:hypothetical protein